MMYAPPTGKRAAKKDDIIVGQDTHIIMVPSPGGPVPTPTPLVFNGIINGNLSPDVFINGSPAATVDSIATNNPPHVPTGGSFQKPPSNQGKILIGSTGVFINGKPAARDGDKAITCNDPTDALVGTVLALGSVFIGETGAGAPKPPAEPKEPKLIEAKLGQPGSIKTVRWGRERAKCGDKVKMIVEVKGFQDGTPANFIVWKKDVDGTDDFISQIEGKVLSGKIEVDWTYSPEELRSTLDREVEEQKGEPEYFFSVEIEGDEVRSGVLTLAYPITVYLEDQDGNPLDGVEYTITLSDGTKRNGKFEAGYARIDDAPYGRFTVALEGYEFIFKK